MNASLLHESPHVLDHHILTLCIATWASTLTMALDINLGHNS